MSNTAHLVPTRAAAPMLGRGQVLHARKRPAAHAFRYDAFFLMLPMRNAHNTAPWQSHWWLSRNRFGLLAFHDADHGDGTRAGLAWLEHLLKTHHVLDANGDIWLQTFPRVLGYAFKPVSFWYCHCADGSLRCVVAEVNNTFGERHAYLLESRDADETPLWGKELRARKVFHVSPFCEVEGEYRFRFMRSGTRSEERLVSRIEYHTRAQDSQALSPLLLTSISGALREATASACLRAFLRYPLFSLAVMARIHWQALQLWLKRVPFHHKPAAPTQVVSRSH